MDKNAQIKMMAKKFNRCSRCGSGSFALEVGINRNPKCNGVYVLCTECGNNMAADNMDRLLADWNTDIYKEPGSGESLSDENRELKDRNEKLAAENARLRKKLEEYSDRRLAAQNRKLKTLVEELKEELDRVLRQRQPGLENFTPEELLDLYDKMMDAEEGRRCAEHARHPGYGARVIDCRTWDEKLA